MRFLYTWRKWLCTLLYSFHLVGDFATNQRSMPTEWHWPLGSSPSPSVPNAGRQSLNGFQSVLFHFGKLPLYPCIFILQR